MEVAEAYEADAPPTACARLYAIIVISLRPHSAVFLRQRRFLLLKPQTA